MTQGRWRENLAEDLTPVQQSMTQDPHDYRGVMQHHRLAVGVVIDVFPCDQEEGNRSARQYDDRHGHQHECSVLVLNDGTSTYMVLENVVIPPSAPSGVDDYVERLPRGSSRLTTGEALSAGLSQTDPYDLDGDMCVVGFIGGQLDQPFIVSWWPHARNLYDTATSGFAAPDANGSGRSLEQARRYFRRINGVETVINSQGDVVVSTTFTGPPESRFRPGGDSTRGRFQREEAETGGSVRIYMKPTATLEWTWDPQEDGIGVQDLADPELPQPNPPPQDPQTNGAKNNTYLNVNDETWLLQVPTSWTVASSDSATIRATNTVTVTTDTLALTGSAGVTMEADQGSVDINSLQASIAMMAALMLTLQSGTNMDLTSGGAMTLGAGGALSLGGSTVAMGPSAGGGPPAGPGAITGDPSGVSLGQGATDFVIKGTSLVALLTAIRTTLVAVPPASDPMAPTASTLANANKAALIAMIGAIESSLSTNTRSL